MAKFKITVLKKIYNEDLVEEYGQPNIHKDPCPHFTTGQEFIVRDALDCPREFCSWAWNDIEKVLMTAWLEGNFGNWMKNNNEFITCCTYGLEPVIFKVEKMEN